jgi:hypothetical protein
MTTIGKVAFIVGILFALFGGIWGGKAYPTNEAVIIILIIAGVIIGLLNITAKETSAVLLATAALLIVAIWVYTPVFVDSVANLSMCLAENTIGVVSAFALLMAPAAIIVAIKQVIAVAKPGE